MNRRKCDACKKKPAAFHLAPNGQERGHVKWQVREGAKPGYVKLCGPDCLLAAMHLAEERKANEGTYDGVM